MWAPTLLSERQGDAALLPLMLDRYQSAIEFGHDPAHGLFDPDRSGAVSPVTRAVALRKGTEGSISSLTSRLPISTGDVSDAAAAEYLELLAVVLEDGKIIGDEARGGMGAEQVRGLNERFLQMMREAAFADQVLTPGELAELKRAADALAVPGYFDDLQPSTTQSNPAADQSTEVPAAKDAKVHKCGHCRTPGNYRSKCPEMN